MAMRQSTKLTPHGLALDPGITPAGPLVLSACTVHMHIVLSSPVGPYVLPQVVRVMSCLSKSKVYLRRPNVALSSRGCRRHGGRRVGGRSPDARVDGGGPGGCRHRRHPRERVREAPEGVHFMPHAHKPCTCKPCTRMHTKERVSPENTSASRTIVQNRKEKGRAPKRAAPTHLRTPSQIPPESLPWHCRGTAALWGCCVANERSAVA